MCNGLRGRGGVRVVYVSIAPDGFCAFCGLGIGNWWNDIADGLAFSHPWLWWVLGLAAFVPFLATVGWFWPAARPMPTLLAVPTYGFFGIVAALQAWIEAVRGNVSPTWEPTRRTQRSVDVSSH